MNTNTNTKNQNGTGGTNSVMKYARLFALLMRMRQACGHPFLVLGKGAKKVTPVAHGVFGGQQSAVPDGSGKVAAIFGGKKIVPGGVSKGELSTINKKREKNPNPSLHLFASLLPSFFSSFLSFLFTSFLSFLLPFFIYHFFLSAHSVELEEEDEEDPEFAGMFGQNFLDALYGRLAAGMRDGASRQGG